MIFDSGHRERNGSRPAAVAGYFYPDDPDALARFVDEAIAAGNRRQRPVPKALIVPHAGYVYSGIVAAAGYARLSPAREQIRRVIVLGPCHRVPVRGIALPSASRFETPLGSVPVDAEAVRAIADCAGVVESAAAHADEHALEVQLPFLQRTLERFSIVPLAVGSASASEVAAVIERLWGGPETLIVVSSDLSHYHSYETARVIDAETVQSILALDGSIDHEQACGATPIDGLLEVARRRRLEAELIDLRNSGDTAGDKRRVVGYASFAFALPDGGAAHADDEDERAYDASHGRTLLALARGSIHEALGVERCAHAQGDWLDEWRATFVTLRRDGELRGCIGTLQPCRTLRKDVRANARGAAFADPRFPALSLHELPRTRIEVSLLSLPKPLAFASRDELFSRVRPGVDGIVLAADGRRATFLPQVWEELAEPESFFAHLKRKARIPIEHPLERCTVERYGVIKWTEHELGLSS